MNGKNNNPCVCNFYPGDHILDDEYFVVALLGHTDLGLLKPDESPVKFFICKKHIEEYSRISHYLLEDFKMLGKSNFVVGVIPGLHVSENTDGQFIEDEKQKMFENLDYEQIRYLSLNIAKDTFGFICDIIHDVRKNGSCVDLIENENAKNINKAILHHLKIEEMKDRERRPEYWAEQDAKKAEEERILALREEYAPLIQSVVKNAINGQEIPDKDIEKLFELGLCNQTTSFRSCHYHPEAFFLFFEFDINGVEHTGYLGFDKNHKYCTLDLRYPIKRLEVLNI